MAAATVTPSSPLLGEPTLAPRTRPPHGAASAAPSDDDERLPLCVAAPLIAAMSLGLWTTVGLAAWALAA